MNQDTLKLRSRQEYSPADGHCGTIDEISLGCMQRIADATELMAKDYRRMQRDLEWHKKSRRDLIEERERLLRQLAATRGVVTRLKKKAKA